MHKSLQKDWIFVKQVTPDIGDAFGPVEEALRDTFMPDLFKVLGG